MGLAQEDITAFVPQTAFRDGLAAPLNIQPWAKRYPSEHRELVDLSYAVASYSWRMALRSCDGFRLGGAPDYNRLTRRGMGPWQLPKLPRSPPTRFPTRTREGHG